MTDNAYAFWQWQIAGKKGQPPEYVATLFDARNSFENPQPGFYRVRSAKGGPLHRVAIWPDENGIGEALKIRIVVQEREITDPLKASQRWTFMSPVTEEQYRSHEADGRWFDEDATVGHNAPPADDDAEALRDQIEAAKAGADAYAEVKDDETAAKAQSLRSRLNELSRLADKKRAALKQPHLEAGKAIDAEYMPLVKDAKAAADAIAKALGAHETRKAREAEKARRKAEEEAAKKGAPAPEPTPEPEPAPAPQTQIKGAYGKAASVRVVKVATVTDQDKAYQAMRTHPELVALIAKLAQRAVDAGHEIAGVEVEEERKVA